MRDRMIDMKDGSSLHRVQGLDGLPCGICLVSMDDEERVLYANRSFLLLMGFSSMEALVAQLTPGRPAAQIANMHTIFNIGTTLLLLPAGNLLAGMAEHLLPDKKSESLAAEQRKAACKKVEDVWNS